MNIDDLEILYQEGDPLSKPIDSRALYAELLKLVEFGYNNHTIDHEHYIRLKQKCEKKII